MWVYTFVFFFSSLLTFSKCFYDNIVFAPFIFIEDPLDANSQLGLTAESATMMLPAVGNHPAGGMNTTGLLGKSSKVDPYYLISHVSTVALRFCLSYLNLTARIFWVHSV